LPPMKAVLRHRPNRHNPVRQRPANRAMPKDYTFTINYLRKQPLPKTPVEKMFNKKNKNC